MSCVDIIAVDVFPPRILRQSDRIGNRKASRFCQFDQHWQIGTVKYGPVLGRTGHKRQVRGRPSEDIGHDDDTVTSIDRVRRSADFSLLLRPIVVLLDRDRTDAGLWTNDMLDRKKVFPRKPTMPYDDNSNQFDPPRSDSASPRCSPEAEKGSAGGCAAVRRSSSL